MRIDPAFRTAACISHGGNLGEAVRRYRIQRGQWIDLSTGINPYGFPIPTIDPAMWLRLPDDDDGLEALAARHYRANHALDAVTAHGFAEITSMRDTGGCAKRRV